MYGLKVVPPGRDLVCLLMVCDKVKDVLIAILTCGRVTPVMDSGHSTINISYEWHSFVNTCEPSINVSTVDDLCPIASDTIIKLLCSNSPLSER